MMKKAGYRHTNCIFYEWRSCCTARGVEIIGETMTNVSYQDVDYIAEIKAKERGAHPACP